MKVESRNKLSNTEDVWDYKCEQNDSSLMCREPYKTSFQFQCSQQGLNPCISHAVVFTNRYCMQHSTWYTMLRNRCSAWNKVDSITVQFNNTISLSKYSINMNQIIYEFPYTDRICLNGSHILYVNKLSRSSHQIFVCMKQKWRTPSI